MVNSNSRLTAPNQFSMKPEILNYVSLPPGAGKTDASIVLMARHARGRPLCRTSESAAFMGLTSTPRYVFYVAPTKQLLRQTYTRLTTKLRGQHVERVRIVYSDSREYDSPVARQIANVFSGLHNDGRPGGTWGKKCVLFMTHASFLLYLGDYPEVCKRALVLFDESRKWALPDSKPFVLDEKSGPYFNSIFSQKKVEGLKGFVRLHALKIPENQKAKLLTKGSALQFPVLDKMHAELSSGRNGMLRTETYMYVANANKHKFINITLPSCPFRGFHSVFILSADFETSEMHRFMEVDGTPPLDVSVAFINEFTREGHTQLVVRATRRYSDVTLIPLLLGSSVPSITKYKNGYPIVPRANVRALGDALTRAGLDKAEMMDDFVLRYATRDKNPLSDADEGIHSILEEHGAILDHHDWLVTKAKEVLTSVPAAHVGQQIVMFVNDGLEAPYTCDSELNFLSHAKAEGDNRWYDHNRGVFLAATNPSQRLTSLLRNRLGSDFDVNQSYVVDKAIQSAGRLAHRDHASDVPVYVVVTNTHMAEQMQNRMTYRAGQQVRQARIDLSYYEALGAYELWDARKYRKEVEAAATEGTHVVHRIKPTKAQAAELKRLRAARKRASDKGLDTSAIEAQIVAIQKAAAVVR